MSADEAQTMIMNTRVMVGWITEEDLLASEDEAVDDEGVEVDSSEETPEATSEINPQAPAEDDVSNETSEPSKDIPTE